MPNLARYRPTSRRPAILAAGIAVLAVVSGAVVNLATDSVPETLAWARNPWLLWSTVALLAVAAAVLAAWSQRPSDRHRSARAVQVGPPIETLTDPVALDLEVHRAIDAGADAAGLGPLPAYILRDHDQKLRAAVARAAAGESLLVMLVGGSSTGKTRACWEAITTSGALLAGWRLSHPIDPGRPEAAAQALEEWVGPKTVVWLNEAQHYLLTPNPTLGERVAAGLRELLRTPSRGPVLVLGTIWPEYWATLTATLSPGIPDSHAHARALLTGTAIEVPDSFTDSDLAALDEQAATDPRLVEARDHAEEGQITQYLAGGPALLERYTTAPPAAKAVITAAMDARRLGHSLPLPRSLLAHAAVGYLTTQQADDLDNDGRWVETALTYASQPCRGARGPLTPSAHTPPTHSSVPSQARTSCGIGSPTTSNSTPALSGGSPPRLLRSGMLPATPPLKTTSMRWRMPPATAAATAMLRCSTSRPPTPVTAAPWRGWPGCGRTWGMRQALRSSPSRPSTLEMPPPCSPWPGRVSMPGTGPGPKRSTGRPPTPGTPTP
jgi:hypothetical protein